VVKRCGRWVVVHLSLPHQFELPALRECREGTRALRRRPHASQCPSGGGVGGGQVLVVCPNRESLFPGLRCQLGWAKAAAGGS
jgi:hypothetical protein